MDYVGGWELFHYNKICPDKNKYKLTNFINIAHEVLKEETPNRFEFCPGQQHLVSSKYILNRTKEFYESLILRFETDILLPYFIERMWRYIFRF